MTTENVKQSLKQWIESQASQYAALASIPIILNGETTEADFPLISIVDTGSESVVENGVPLYGVDEIAINAEVHSVPDDTANDATSIADHRAIVAALAEILADRNAITFCDGLNGTAIFDIRRAASSMEPSDGRRVSTIQLTVIACPLT
jgi:hypothetical protein